MSVDSWPYKAKAVPTTEHKLMTHALYKTPNPQNFFNRRRCQISQKPDKTSPNLSDSNITVFQTSSNQFVVIFVPVSDLLPLTLLKTLNNVCFSEVLLFAVYCVLLPFCFLTNFFFSFFMVFFSIFFIYSKKPSKILTNLVKFLWLSQNI